ncbi:hypothetical protein KCP76_20150 [Salmonella enterica subsp. enterica serovar Weltevreden]|nr:hypothetical protein KCP76_20150 [Salmonella enterica subsp. enterica serovar Weltevreden]
MGARAADRPVEWAAGWGKYGCDAARRTSPPPCNALQMPDDKVFTQSAARRSGCCASADRPAAGRTRYRISPVIRFRRPTGWSRTSPVKAASGWMKPAAAGCPCFSATGGTPALLPIIGWHHYYTDNRQSGITVLEQAKAFWQTGTGRRREWTNMATCSCR